MPGIASNEVREFGGFLGDGEKTDGTLTVAEFLEKYPQGVFRPLAKVAGVELVNYSNGDEVGMYSGN